MSHSIELVRSLYAAFGRSDLPAILEMLTDDVDWRVHAPQEVPYGGRYAGRKGVPTFFEKLGGSVRLTAFEPRNFLEDGDTVVVLGRDQGVANATGRPFANDWVHVFKLRDGQVAAFQEFLESEPLQAAFRNG